MIKVRSLNFSVVVGSLAYLSDSCAVASENSAIAENAARVNGTRNILWKLVNTDDEVAGACSVVDGFEHNGTR